MFVPGTEDVACYLIPGILGLYNFLKIPRFDVEWLLDGSGKTL
jgi:hypothetical protein